MAKIGLSFYSVRVLAPIKDKAKDEYEFIGLDNINGKNITDCIYDFLLVKAKEYQKDSEKEKIYRPYQIETYDHFVGEDYYFSSIYGIVKSGDYGVEVEIVDSDTSEKVFNQKKEQAGVLPFGFALYFTEGVSTGILVTQSFGSKGMSNHFKNIIENSVEKFCDKFKVKIQNVFPDKYFKRLMEKEQIKDICLETYRKAKPDDKDNTTNNMDLIDYSTKEIKYRNPLLKDKDKLYNIFTKRHSLSEIQGLTNEDEEIKNLKINFVVNGVSKTVNYDTYFNLRISENITDEVSINKDTGHPYSVSLFELMDTYVNMYLINMKIIEAADKNKKCTKIWKRHSHIKINDKNEEEVIDKNNERDIVNV